MNISRRRSCVIAAASLLAARFRSVAWADTYPNRPIHLLVGLAPGGAQDTFARMLAEALSRSLGQPVVVENQAGAGTNIATQTVARASPDGYTLLLVGAPNSINATLYSSLPFNFLRDIAPVAPVATTPEVLIAHPALPIATVPDLIAFARAHPGELNIASPGNGTGPHLSAELLKMMAGIDLQHVAHRGGAPALIDLLAGRVQLTFIAPAVVLNHIAARKVHPLAVTSSVRCPVLPDVPPLADYLPGFESGGFFGIGAPARTSPAVVDRLNRETNAILSRADVGERIRAQGAIVWRGSAQDLGSRIKVETAKWARVVKAINLKPT